LLEASLLGLSWEEIARLCRTKPRAGLAPWPALPLQPLLWILSLAGRLMVRLRKPVTGRERGKTEAAALKEISATAFSSLW
jgi:hypothetical protein